jgi:hypothetical protein
MAEKQKLITEGTVKSLRKDGKGLQLNDGSWYSSSYFHGKLPNKGDQIELAYTLGGENNQYKNLCEVKVKQAAAFTPANQLPVFQKEAREDKALTMLVSYSKDIVTETMKYSCEKKLDFDLKAVFKMANEQVWESYEYFKGRLKDAPAVTPEELEQTE